MGINGLFPKISPACHQADVVALLRPGLPVSSDEVVGLPPLADDETSSATRTNANGKRSADAAAAGADSSATAAAAAAGPTKRRRTGKKTPTKTSASARRRRVRVAVDASGWIARAAHGQGTHLLDERTLTNYGRAELTGSVEKGSNAAAAAATADGPEGTGVAAAPAADEDAYDEALRQEYKQRCVTTVIKRVLTLRDVCLADVLVVLDGASPPVKKATVGQRRDRRDAAVAMRDAPVAAAASAAEGGDLGEEQQQQQQQQVPSETDRISAAKRAGAATSQIQYEIVHAVMVALQSECIPYLVAPYEADGQLGYLARTGLVDMIVTDDTDLMACGASSILYKFSDWGLNHGVSGGVVSGGVTGQLFLRSRLGCTPSPLSLLDFTDVMLAAMFVAAGCDYCKNLKGIGIVTARKCVKEAFHGYGPSMSSSEANADNPVGKRTTTAGDTEPKLSKLFRLLYKNGYSGKKMTREERAEYETNFCKALIMFRHPVVFDPIAAKCVVVNDPALGGADPQLCTFKTYANLVNDPAMLQEIVGKILTPARASLIAEGRVNARTGRPFGEKKDEQVESIEQRGGEETSGTTADTTGEGVTAAAPAAAANNDGRAMLIDTGEEEQKDEDGQNDEEESGILEGEKAMNADTSKELAGKPADQQKKDKRLCRIDGCKNFKQANCDDMCRAHWKEASSSQKPPSDESEEDEEEEMLATQQPQPLEMQDESPIAQGESQVSIDDSEKTQDIDAKDIGAEESNSPAAEAGVDATDSIPPKDKRLCRIDGCAKYKRSKCDDMCRAHWKERQEATDEAEDENAEGRDEGDEEQEALATQQPQPFEAHSQESEPQIELPATQPSPSERETALSFATQAELQPTQSQLPETQEQFTAREFLSPATAAASEAQALTAWGTQDSEATSQPATQASSGNATSQLSSSQSQDPDALSPDLLAPTPPQETPDTQDNAEVGDEDKNEGVAGTEAVEKGAISTESPPRAQRKNVPAQSPPRGIQGVLARLMGRK